MRCSSCEPLLDQYREGTLSARRTIDVAHHLRGCPSCTTLIAELKVVDALLATIKPLEPAPNFTFAVMAEVRTQPAPHRRPRYHWFALCAYVALAWVAVALVVTGGEGTRAALDSLAASLAILAAGAQSVMHIAGATVASVPLAAAAGTGILLVDAFICAGIVYFYRSVRPRLAAHLSSSPEAS
ncbi:MAG: anti-sigma factor family protein [Vulcanimicrobiaceae bacterium]